MPDPTPSSSQSDRFLYVVCQNGADAAVKQELTTAYPKLKSAFSRPGFVTFKVPPSSSIPERINLRSTLARAYGWSIGKIEGTDALEMVRQAKHHFNVACPPGKTLGDCPSPHFHVWQRDLSMPGKGKFEPGVTPLANEIGNLFRESDTESNPEQKITVRINQMARPNEQVFDVVMVETNQWWLGYHYATSIPSRWPGGTPQVNTNVETASRAYYKTREALEWSGIEIHQGDICAEIGSAPGGCCQWLLEKGAKVIGIDPAEMHPDVLNHENFTHIRRRGHEVRKRDLKDVQWLFADIRAIPKHTLDTIETIIEHDAVTPKALILTMKLAEWEMIDEIPQWMARVRQMGFGVVKARQLAFNRHEFCLVAVKDKFVIRKSKQRPVKR